MLLIIPIICFRLLAFKLSLKINKEKELENKFIKEFKEKYKTDNNFTKIEFEYKNNYHLNYIKDRWCSKCKYYVEILDNDKHTEYAKGICKLKYKQDLRLKNSKVYNDWYCKWFSW